MEKLYNDLFTEIADTTGHDLEQQVIQHRLAELSRLPVDNSLLIQRAQLIGLLD